MTHAGVHHGGHSAFGYLSKRYVLKYRPALPSMTADAEPTAADLADLVKQMRKSGIKYLYSEELLSPRTAETIANEAGAKILMLHGPQHQQG